MRIDCSSAPAEATSVAKTIPIRPGSKGGALFGNANQIDKLRSCGEPNHPPVHGKKVILRDNTVVKEQSQAFIPRRKKWTHPALSKELKTGFCSPSHEAEAYVYPGVNHRPAELPPLSGCRRPDALIPFGERVKSLLGRRNMQRASA